MPLWDKVEKTDTCWLWQGTLTRPVDGYGQVRLNGKMVTVHRAVYEALVGPIPEGLTLDHLCRVRRCVNPAHLEPVTMRENILRGEGACAQHARKTHCDRGHLLKGDNLSIVNQGRSRRCKTCKRITENARRAKART